MRGLTALRGFESRPLRQRFHKENAISRVCLWPNPCRTRPVFRTKNGPEFGGQIRSTVKIKPRSNPTSRRLNMVRNREIASAADSIHRQTGLTHRFVKDGVRISGQYRGSLQLASGRFAMLSDGVGFELVPWRPMIENSMGKTISAVVRGDHVAWQLGRQRGLSL